MTINSQQVKAARELLGWTLKTLEGKSGITSMIIANFEADKRSPSVLQLAVLRRVIESAGIEFDDKGHGVRLKVEQ